MDNEYCDPVELASGIQELIKKIKDLLLNAHHFLEAVHYIGSLPIFERSWDDFVLSLWDLRAHLTLLEEASTDALNSPFPPPLSALSAANQSAWLLTHISGVLIEWRRKCGHTRDGKRLSQFQRVRAIAHLPFVAPRLSALVERLEQAIIRLRHIVSDSATQRLLEQARFAFESISLQNGDHRTAGSAPESVGDPTLFDAEIVMSGKKGTHGCLYVHARGKLDNGADCNLVNVKILQKYGLENQIQDLESEVLFDLVGGKNFKATKKITLSWKTRASRQCLDTEFYVANEMQFDLLFGQAFIEEKGYHILKARGLYPITWTPSKEKRKHIQDSHQKSRERALSQIRLEEKKWMENKMAAEGSHSLLPSQTGAIVKHSTQTSPQTHQNISSCHYLPPQATITTGMTAASHYQIRNGDSAAEPGAQQPKVEEIIDEDDPALAQTSSDGHLIPAVSGEDFTSTEFRTSVTGTSQHPSLISVKKADRISDNINQSVSDQPEIPTSPRKPNSKLPKQRDVSNRDSEGRSKFLIAVSKRNEIRESVKVVRKLFRRE